MAPLVHFRMPSAFLYTLRLAQPAIEKRVLRAAEQDGQAGGQEFGFRVFPVWEVVWLLWEVRAISPFVAERPSSRQAFDTFSYGSVRHVPIYLMEV